MQRIWRPVSTLVLASIVLVACEGTPTATTPDAAATIAAPTIAQPTDLPTAALATATAGMDMNATVTTGTMDMGSTETTSSMDMGGGMDMDASATAGGMDMGGSMDMGGMNNGTAVPTVTPGIPTEIPVATPDLSAFPVTIENCGRMLTFQQPPERVVAMYPLTAELLLRLGLQDRIVGAAFTSTDPVAPDLRAAYYALPILTTDTSPNKEVLLSAQPDFVIDNFPWLFYSAAQGNATVEELNASGAQVYTLTARCDGNETNGKVDDIFTDLANLGKVFGVSDRASALIEQYRGRLTAVQEAVADQPKVRVMIYDSGTGPINLYGPGAISDVAVKAGAENVFADGDSEFLMISAEEVATRNPDVFVVFQREGERQMSMGASLGAQQAADYLIQTFPNTSAGQNKRVVIVPYQQLYASLQTVNGVEALARQFYPDAFR